MFHFQCRGLVLFTIFVPRIVGRQFRVRNSVSGLSGSNFVYKILSADCREAILCAKFRQRIVGRQFRVQNSVSGSSGGNFVCRIPSADRREAISCAKFVPWHSAEQFFTFSSCCCARNHGNLMKGRTFAEKSLLVLPKCILSLYG